jgi:hypothetical protein
LPDSKFINLKIGDKIYLEQLSSSLEFISIEGHNLAVDAVNLLSRPNFITVMITGLSTDPQDHPHFAEFKEMAAAFAVQLDSKPKDGTPPMAKVTDVYGECHTFADFEIDEIHFTGILRAAVRLFPSVSHAGELPGYFRFFDYYQPFQYRGRGDHCIKCRDKPAGGRYHTTPNCPNNPTDKPNVYYECGEPGHIRPKYPTLHKAKTQTEAGGPTAKRHPDPEGSEENDPNKRSRAGNP